MPCMMPLHSCASVFFCRWICSGPPGKREPGAITFNYSCSGTHVHDGYNVWHWVIKCPELRPASTIARYLDEVPKYLRRHQMQLLLPGEQNRALNPFSGSL